jgi:hypothetical protein
MNLQLSTNPLQRNLQGLRAALGAAAANKLQQFSEAMLLCAVGGALSGAAITASLTDKGRAYWTNFFQASVGINANDRYSVHSPLKLALSADQVSVWPTSPKPTAPYTSFASKGRAPALSKPAINAPSPAREAVASTDTANNTPNAVEQERREGVTTQVARVEPVVNGRPFIPLPGPAGGMVETRYTNTTEPPSASAVTLPVTTTRAREKAPASADEEPAVRDDSRSVIVFPSQRAKLDMPLDKQPVPQQSGQLLVTRVPSAFSVPLNPATEAE